MAEPVGRKLENLNLGGVLLQYLLWRLVLQELLIVFATQED
jgi:hypothetical protein